MSDIGIMRDPLSIVLIALLLGSPGLPLGAIVGALLWRRHRIIGTLVGGVVGFALWLAGWLVLEGPI